MSNRHYSQRDALVISCWLACPQRANQCACMQAPDNPQPPLALISGPVKLGASCAGGSALGITFDGRASPPSANRQLASCAPIHLAAGTH